MNLKDIDWQAGFDKSVVGMRWALRGLDKLKCIDFIAPLLLRLYLVPVLWMAGSKKFANFSDTAAWFGDEQWGLGLPLPYLLVFLVALIEVLGAVFLLIGFGVRLISLPLMIVMAVAGVLVHLKNGWLAIATGSGLLATDRTIGAVERLEQAKSILQQYGNYDWLTENGAFVVLNNGVEFAATYFIMLLVLFFIGAGRYVSIDYWLAAKYSEE
ncbi:HvfX family Cu-binding RiPP maturation protein [Methylotuvimicrobium alcaliphilum]|uniref:DoxX family protein n=1 Tax=Methylotuvimicrobium alcaliphilum (strain DSM 19304 / NCIMB 14124 / VKM B-2133 / 20Z) TaxID=1091494 RepID=G4T3B8_META2|nr:DoxX family protein [Methylotuvimicrobium alcaliphilum]CCE22610.1 DoxX family protein [Methylotuvimicrobium alcaliphilum 20Z]